jgi:hypothetical protein
MRQQRDLDCCQFANSDVEEKIKMRAGMGKYFCLHIVFHLGVNALAALAPVEKPKVLVELAKLVDDQINILVPARVEAKIQSLVTADVEGHAVQILKPLGAVVQAGETVLFLENKDPGFTYRKSANSFSNIRRDQSISYWIDV